MESFQDVMKEIPMFIFNIIIVNRKMRNYETTRPPFNGKRFIGNTDKNIVHDLDNEDTAENGWQIDEIKVDHIKNFTPDS